MTGARGVFEVSVGSRWWVCRAGKLLFVGGELVQRDVPCLARRASESSFTWRQRKGPDASWIYSPAFMDRPAHSGDRSSGKVAPCKADL